MRFFSKVLSPDVWHTAGLYHGDLHACQLHDRPMMNMHYISRIPYVCEYAIRRCAKSAFDSNGFWSVALEKNAPDDTKPFAFPPSVSNSVRKLFYQKSYHMLQVADGAAVSIHCTGCVTCASSTTSTGRDVLDDQILRCNALIDRSLSSKIKTIYD